MTEPAVRAFDLEAQPWERHARFPAILIKVLESRATHPHLSLTLVEVAVDGVIDTHHHEVETETAVVLAGQGVLVWGADEQQTALARGGGVSIQPRTPHSLRNTGGVPLQLLAVHAPGGR